MTLTQQIHLSKEREFRKNRDWYQKRDKLFALRWLKERGMIDKEGEKSLEELVKIEDQINSHV